MIGQPHQDDCGDLRLRGSPVWRIGVALCLLVLLGQTVRTFAGDWLAPAALALAADGQTLHVAGARGRQVFTLEVSSGQTLRTVPLDEKSTGLALSADERQWAVTCVGWTNAVVSLDPSNGQIKHQLPIGASACSPLFNRAGARLHVCLRFEDAVVAMDLTTGRNER